VIDLSANSGMNPDIEQGIKLSIIRAFSKIGLKPDEIQIDERVYVRKFSKRKPRSNWSALNRKKAEELIDRGLMTEHGMKAIEVAQNNGQWSKSDEREEIVDVDGLRRIIMNRTGRGDAYDRLSEPLKKHYSTVYFSARREDTRNKRLELIMEYMKTKKRFM